MKTTNFKIKDRQIEMLNYQVMAGYQNVDTFHFEFDDEWEGLDKTLKLIVEDKKYHIAILNGEAILPSEVYERSGNIAFGVFGVGDKTTLATTLTTFYVHDGAYGEGEEPSNLPTPTQWDLYVEEINKLLDESNKIKEECDEILKKVIAIGGVDGAAMDYKFLSNKPKINNIELTDNKTFEDLGFSKVSMSGSYNDLNNKPTIPTNNNQLTNGAGYQTSSDVQTAINNALSSITGYTETDPTVPAWAKQSKKPKYTYDEITDKPTFSEVATSGSYNNLKDKPTIPSIEGLATEEFVTDAILSAIGGALNGSY